MNKTKQKLETKAQWAPSKVIRISPKVASLLERERKGFETRTDVLERLLGIGKGGAK